VTDIVQRIIDAMGDAIRNQEAAIGGRDMRRQLGFDDEPEGWPG
jgi:hypothetical protein